MTCGGGGVAAPGDGTPQAGDGGAEVAGGSEV